MQNTKVTEGKLSSGINYEIHVAENFSGSSEIALKVENEIVSVIAIHKNKGGTIECRPYIGGVKKIGTKPQAEVKVEQVKPTL